MSDELEIRTFTLESMPMFPSNVTVGGVSIRLHANGSWEGDRNAFIAACEAQKQDPTGVTMPIIWLIVNAISRVEG